MDILELKKEQLKLAPKIVLQDTVKQIKTIGGVKCQQVKNKLIASIVVLELPSLKLKEKKFFVLDNPLPYMQGYQAYRDLPAIIEAFNQLEEEPDILLVEAFGVNHPRGIGMASHLGLVLNQPTIGITDGVGFGIVEKGKIRINGQIVGFEMKTKDHARPIYVSPGYNVSLGTSLQLIQKVIKFPHKMPEPLHLAKKLAKKKVLKLNFD